MSCKDDPAPAAAHRAEQNLVPGVVLLLLMWLLPVVSVASRGHKASWHVPAATSENGGGFLAPKCAGELLHNGICLPREWPPRWATANGLPPRDAPLPPWILAPPSVINISTGRQLFVDTYLVWEMSGLQLLNHAARWEEQALLMATEPWEAMASVKNQSWPQASRAVGYAQPFSGGVWYDEQRSPRPCYRAWYSCGSNLPEAAASANEPGGCCLAESEDGLRWTKPLVGTGRVKGTNVVLEEAFDTNTVSSGLHSSAHQLPMMVPWYWV